MTVSEKHGIHHNAAGPIAIILTNACQATTGRTSVWMALDVFIKPHQPHKRPCVNLVSMTLLVQRACFQMSISHVGDKVRWKAMMFVKGPDLFSGHFQRLGHSDACHRGWSPNGCCPSVLATSIQFLEFNPDGVFQLSYMFLHTLKECCHTNDSWHWCADGQHDWFLFSLGKFLCLRADNDCSPPHLDDDFLSIL